MPLPGRQFEDDSFLSAFGGRDLPTTLDESIDATVADPRLRPTQLLAELQKQQPARVVRGSRKLVGPTREEEGPDLSPEEIKRDYGHLGVKFDTPTSERVVRLTASRRQEDMQRDEIIRASPQNLGSMGVRFGAALLGSAVDPINVASAFIPVVREARFAAIAGVGGRTVARGVSGAAAGVVGASAVEPISLLAARQLQLDYSMADALLNVALGGVLGGGLHMGGGAIADRFKRFNTRPDTGRSAVKESQTIRQEQAFQSSPVARETAYKASVAQVVRGSDVDVAPIFELDSAARTLEVESSGIVHRTVTENHPEVRDIISYFRSVKEAQAEIRSNPQPGSQSLTQFLMTKGGLKDFRGEVATILGDANFRVSGVRGRPKILNEKTGRNLDDAALAAFEAGYFRERPTLSEFLDALDEDVRGGGYFTRDNERVRSTTDEIDSGIQSLDEMGLRISMSERDAVRGAIEHVKAQQESSVIPSTRTIAQTFQEKPDTVKRLAENREPHDLQDLRETADAAEVADEFGAQTAKNLDEALDDALEEMRNEGFNPDEDEVLAMLNGWVDDADGLAPAIRQGASCMARAA